jgi:hypothetical protein
MIFEHRDLILEPQLPLLDPGELEKVGTRRAAKGLDRRVQITMFLPQPLDAPNDFFGLHRAPPVKPAIGLEANGAPLNHSIVTVDHSPSRFPMQPIADGQF